jgi:hypothetical protein
MRLYSAQDTDLHAKPNTHNGDLFGVVQVV